MPSLLVLRVVVRVLGGMRCGRSRNLHNPLPGGAHWGCGQVCCPRVAGAAGVGLASAPQRCARGNGWRPARIAEGGDLGRQLVRAHHAHGWCVAEHCAELSHGAWLRQASSKTKWQRVPQVKFARGPRVAQMAIPFKCETTPR